ncbi:glycosyltransferase family 39 protein [Kitasatospora aburaviensis]
MLAVQAALSLRLLGAAHPDEAIAMIVGRQELNHLFDGTPMTTDLVERIPGAPWLYPPLAGAAANASGIFGARVVSLVLALVTTVLAYSLTRRLFNERVAICGAAAYAVVQSTVVVGFYAAPDALAIALVAVTAWIVVRTARAPVALVLLAAPVAALAVAAEYAAVVALPAVLALAVLSASARKGRGPAALRALLLAVGTVGLLLPFGLLDDVAAWSPTQGHEARSAGSVLLSAAQWSGLFTLLACAGAAAYVRRERMYESPEDDEITATRLRRAALSITLCGTALLIPVLYACLGTSGVMFRHLGFGMLFAAPLAGVGITRLVGAHFRNPSWASWRGWCCSPSGWSRRPCGTRTAPTPAGCSACCACTPSRTAAATSPRWRGCRSTTWAASASPTSGSRPAGAPSTRTGPAWCTAATTARSPPSGTAGSTWSSSTAPRRAP